MVPQEYTGWFRRSTLDQLRDHIRARFMGLMPDELARELQGLPRSSWAPSLKTITWKDNEDAPNNDVGPLCDQVPATAPLVDETGCCIIYHYTIFQFFVVMFLALTPKVTTPNCNTLSTQHGCYC